MKLLYFTQWISEETKNEKNKYLLGICKRSSVYPCSYVQSNIFKKFEKFSGIMNYYISNTNITRQIKPYSTLGFIRPVFVLAGFKVTSYQFYTMPCKAFIALMELN